MEKNGTFNGTISGWSAGEITRSLARAIRNQMMLEQKERKTPFIEELFGRVFVTITDSGDVQWSFDPPPSFRNRPDYLKLTNGQTLREVLDDYGSLTETEMPA